MLPWNFPFWGQLQSCVLPYAMLGDDGMTEQLTSPIPADNPY
jgi:hypothetical protein